MKKTTKALALVLCAMLLVAGSVMGTLAYLTDEEAVSNTFTVGNVVIYLDETDIDNSNTNNGNEPLLNSGRDIANQYIGDNKLIPGRTVTKDPIVWVREDSEPAYLRMIVEVTSYDKLVEAVGVDYMVDDMVALDKLVTEWKFDTWEFHAFKKEDTTATYEFRYYPNDGIYTATNNNDVNVDYNELPALFKGIKIPEAMNNEDIAKLANVGINITAQAIQAEGFVAVGEKTAEDMAWEAFPAN